MGVLRHLVLLCVLNTSQGVLLSVFTKDTYPDPQVNYTDCGRTETSWVCDPGRYMTDRQVAVLDANVNGLGGRGVPATIMVAVVPQLIGKDGRAASSSEELKEFTNYLQQTAWRTHATNLLVLVYHVSGNAAWVQSDFSQIASECICQLNYESQQYFTSTAFPMLLDIFTSKFREILLETGTCTTPADNVPWKVNAIGVCSWSRAILVTGMNPEVGLPEGGMEVQLFGDNFDMTAGNILIGTQNCVVTSRSSTILKCITAALDNLQNVNTPMSVYLQLGNIKYDTGRRFVYKMPKLKAIRPATTTISGGLQLTVEGENLDLVKTASMVTTLTGKHTHKQVEYITSCEPATEMHMYCVTPTLEMERVRSQIIKRDLVRANKMSRVRHRTVRAADSQSQSVDDVVVTVRVISNGKPLSINDIQDKDMRLSVFFDPELYSFDGEEQTETFVSVWPKNERQMEVLGSGLLPALKDHEVFVLVGDGVCDANEMYSNRLVCNPPIYEPNTAGGAMHPFVQVSVGKLQFRIGYLEYHDTLWKYPPTRYALLGVGAVLLLGIILLVCCCFSRNKKFRRIYAETMEDQQRKTKGK